MNKPWIENYPEGVPAELPAYPYRSLGEFLGRVARLRGPFCAYGDAPAASRPDTTALHACGSRASLLAYMKNGVGFTSIASLVEWAFDKMDLCHEGSTPWKLDA